MPSNNLQKQIKQALLVVLGFLIVFVLLYLWARGKSGGDMSLALFSIIFLGVYTLILGVSTYPKSFREKTGIISGLLLSFLLMYLLLRIIA